MILDGIKLTFVGMGTVFVFLILLITSITIISKLIKPLEDLLGMKDDKPPAGLPPQQSSGNDSIIAAIISTAVYNYRKKRG